MKTLFHSLLLVMITWPLSAQHPFKSIQDQPNTPLPDFSPAFDIPGALSRGVSSTKYHTIRFDGSAPASENIARQVVTGNGSYWIDLKPNTLWSSRASVREVIAHLLPGSIYRDGLPADWQVTDESTDPLGMTHVRVQQLVGGRPVYGQELVLHVRDGELESLNGFAWTGKVPATVENVSVSSQAVEAARAYVASQGIAFSQAEAKPWLPAGQDEAELVWMPGIGGLQPAYHVTIHPNLLDHWTVFIHAMTLDVMGGHSGRCSFVPEFLADRIKAELAGPASGIMPTDKPAIAAAPLLDGATTITDTDLLGVGRTVNGWQVGSNFFMIDASRPSMFNPSQSDMPDNPVGVIWTIDAFNTSPENSNFQVGHCTNTNNNWKALEVSAHFNGGSAFEYFRNTFNRNSINGKGGNVISIVNVADSDGSGLDNAFWTGTAIFYGNGNVGFQALARGLDVAGHEMSHGVIDNTANLEYVGQSGALNESYADIFGAMIDRDDWKIGEDVVNTNVFPSGALRDLENPNNGGSGPGSNGWQPKHMNEFVTLPNTPQGDNGGVHVNSGIPNRAFFLVANAIGRNKAEQIYYRALVNYLVKSSQFIDMRNAAERAATDLHGAGSAEVNAVRAAYDAVGIGAGAGGDYEVDLAPSPGPDFFLATDEQSSDLYWVPPANPAQLVKLNVPAPLSRPSFTDNGNACVYVNQSGDLILLQFDWTFGLEYGWNFLEGSPQGGWRNIVVSKSGDRLAYTTAQLRNQIRAYDFALQSEKVFTLYNPTTAPGGINAGDVLYADAMEWDYSGYYILYDALNHIEGTFGDGIEYWNIAYVNAWDELAGNFGGGQIGTVFSGLPENVSVGNPSLSKNSPYIITFDYLETNQDIFGQPVTTYLVLAANLETGEVGEVFENTTVGYPCYNKEDDQILFTYDDNGSLLLATVDMQPDKLSPVAGTETAIVLGAQKGVWFLTGERDITATEDISSPDDLAVRPQPVADYIEVLLPETNGCRFTIHDAAGRMLDSGNMTGSGRIAVDRFPAGWYVLRVADANGIVHRARFIKG